jgi:hypothetical protein
MEKPREDEKGGPAWDVPFAELRLDDRLAAECVGRRVETQRLLKHALGIGEASHVAGVGWPTSERTVDLGVEPPVGIGMAR